MKVVFDFHYFIHSNIKPDKTQNTFPFSFFSLKLITISATYNFFIIKTKNFNFVRNVFNTKNYIYTNKYKMKPFNTSR